MARCSGRCRCNGAKNETPQRSSCRSCQHLRDTFGIVGLELNESKLHAWIAKMMYIDVCACVYETAALPDPLSNQVYASGRNIFFKEIVYYASENIRKI